MTSRTVRWLVPIASAAALAGTLAVASLDEEREDDRVPRVDAVLYGIGLSTDPYGHSRPRGAGIAFGIGRRAHRRETVRDRNLRPVTWIADARVLAVDFVDDRPRHRILEVRHELRDGGRTPFPPRALNPLQSPDGRRFAYALAVACRAPNPRMSCYRPSKRTFVVDAGRASEPPRTVNGQALGWTPRGRLVLASRGDLEAVEPRRRRRTTLLSRDRVAGRVGAHRRGFLSAPIWTADGRYFAAIAHLVYPRAEARRRVGTVVVASGAGRIVRVFTSRYTISMLAWSPRGHRLAWTTSGFPDPHELLVANLDREAPPRRLYVTERHFDWIAWAPDAEHLLVDDENRRPPSWRLLNASGPPRARTLRRLGGQPQWCCPQNPYVTVAGGWSTGVR